MARWITLTDIDVPTRPVLVRADAVTTITPLNLRGSSPALGSYVSTADSAGDALRVKETPAQVLRLCDPEATVAAAQDS